MSKLILTKSIPIKLIQSEINFTKNRTKHAINSPKWAPIIKLQAKGYLRHSSPSTLDEEIDRLVSRLHNHTRNL